MIDFWMGIILLAVILLVVRIAEEVVTHSDGAVTGLLVLILALFLFFGIASCESRVSKEYSETESISSLRTGDETEGQFFIGIGSFSKNSYYYCYTGDSVGGYVVSSFDVEKTFIIPSDLAVDGTVVRDYVEKTMIYPGNFIFGDNGLISISSWEMGASLEKTSLVLPSKYIVFEYNEIK